jgi:hypothetical protein
MHPDDSKVTGESMVKAQTRVMGKEKIECRGEAVEK